MSVISASTDSVSAAAASGDAPASGIAVRADIVRSWEDVRAFEGAWDALAERSGAEISSFPGYARTWWTHYGRGRLAVVVCRRGDRLVGVLPMFVERVGPWPIGARVAKLMGSDSTIAVMSPAVEPEHAAESIASAVRELVERDGCDVVHLGPMQGDTGAAGAVREALGGGLRERRVGVLTRWDLPGTFEEYLASLEKSERSNLKRNLNKIGKASGSKVRVVRDAEEIVAAMDRFVPMHAKQWEAEGKPGHFGDWRGSEAFAREAVREQSKRGRVAFVEQEIEGECVCSYWSYVVVGAGSGRAYWRLPAREVGEKWDAYALGRVGLVMMLRELIGMGVRYVDGGPGHYDYKLRLGATEHPLVSFMFVKAGWASRARASLLTRWADLVHLVYYRAWRLKFGPRVKWKSGALRRVWVRSRV
ncbi:MAG: GNAT family N-acetyltransferase [Phycisphaerales bacterium]